ncbi:MAG: MBL fold metallo-hydrolase [Nitrospirota bacterium]|nr:MBL fold metallo-hydrolase [Nitrospirota bacterium]
MKALLPNIWEWSWFSEEKQLNFNGHLLTVGEHRILVDPPPMNAKQMALARQGGPVDYIILTNRDHVREAGQLREEFHCTVMAPELDAPEMALTIDKTFKDGELLPGGIWVIQLAHQKSPGESALFLDTGKGILIVGDAIIAHPPGTLRLLPAEKYADMTQAREGLRRLLKYKFDSLLVGDGTSLVTGAKPVLDQMLAEA